MEMVAPAFPLSIFTVGNYPEGDRVDKPEAIPLEAFLGEGLSITTDNAAMISLAEADVILGVDVRSQHEFLLYGRRLLEQIARAGEERPYRLLRITVDRTSADLEKLIGLVTVVKGGHDYDSDQTGDYAPAGIARGFEPGETSTITTNDLGPGLDSKRAADERQVKTAVESVRRQGDPRPVLLIFPAESDSPSPFSKRVREQVRNATPVRLLGWGGDAFVLSRQDARHAVEAVIGKQARDLFRRHDWPESYYTAILHARGTLEVHESRFFDDRGEKTI
jgi:hypothetical protein